MFSLFHSFILYCTIQSIPFEHARHYSHLPLFLTLSTHQLQTVLRLIHLHPHLQQHFPHLKPIFHLIHNTRLPPMFAPHAQPTLRIAHLLRHLVLLVCDVLTGGIGVLTGKLGVGLRHIGFVEGRLLVEAEAISHVTFLLS